MKSVHFIIDMEYKAIPGITNFLPEDELNETKKSIFVNFNDLEKQGKLEETFDYIINDWMGFIFALPITTPIFFDLIQNGRMHSCKATPEKINVIMNCLQTRNFDEIINANPISSDPPNAIEGVINVSGFGIRIYPFKERQTKNQWSGSFFNYIAEEKIPRCIKEQIERYQIFTSLVDDKGHCKKALEDSCFVYSLKMSHQFQESVLNQISIKNKKFIGVKQEEATYFIEMNLYQNHYFIEEVTPFSCYYVKHFETEDEINCTREFNPQNNNYRKSRFFSKSSDLIRTLFEKGYFVPITYGHYMVLNTEFHKLQDSDSCDYDLHYDRDYCSQLIIKKPLKQKDEKEIFFADFESDVSEEIHRPFLCVLQNINGTENKIFKEGSCGKDLLDYLPHNSITYFHNLAYDIRMFAHYGIQKSIIKGTRCLSACIGWKNKNLFFKDSLALFNCKLSQLPLMFGLTGIEKELFPYKYYTFTQLAESEILTDNDDIISGGIINEAGKYEDTPWGETEYTQFNINIDKIGARLGENKFDMYKYAEFYCSQDVRILRESYNIFRKGFKTDFNIDVLNYISISSLANEVFRQNVYIPNQKLYKLGGHVRHFCSKAVYGGRCMCAYNKKWHIHANLCDYDAVSLYPSAMARLWTVEGIP